MSNRILQQLGVFILAIAFAVFIVFINNRKSKIKKQVK